MGLLQYTIGIFKILATEMFKVYNNIAPPIEVRITENISFLGPKILDIVLTELKEVKFLSTFQSGIKN